MDQGAWIVRWSAGVALVVVATAAIGRAQQPPAAPTGPPASGRMWAPDDTGKNFKEVRVDPHYY